MTQKSLFEALDQITGGLEPGPCQKISEIPFEERPSYKIEKYPNSMSSRELLALLIGGENQLEVAYHLYQACSGDLRKLGREYFPEEITGIGKVIATRILAAVQLGEKLSKPSPLSTTVITCPEDAADLVAYEMKALEQEQLRVLLLNTRNHVMGIEKIYQGTLHTSQVRVGELFRVAVRKNAAAVIIFHNHPSGAASPSADDVEITRIIVEAGKLLGIPVLDHIIIGRDQFISLNRKGLGFTKK